MFNRARTMSPLLLTAALWPLTGVAADPASDDERAALPRYVFKVGQELSYQAHSEFRAEDGPPLKSDYTWQVWVIRQNDDGSWRLILRQSSSYQMPPAAEGREKNADQPSKPNGSPKPDRAGKPEQAGKPNQAGNPGPAKTQPAATPAPAAPPEFVTFAYCDLFPDGRISDNPTIDDRLEPRLLFPKLPKNSKELENGWSDARRKMQVSYRYQVAKRPADDDDSQQWEIRATRQSPTDEVLLSSTKATYLFDAERGVIESVESQLRQGYGPAGEGTNQTELAGTENFDQAWTRQLDEEMQTYFDVQQRYRELLEAAQRNSTETETLLLDAGALLQHAAGQVSLPVIKEELSKQLALHALNAGFAARAARDRADLIDAPAPTWQVKDLDGKSHSLKNYKGKVIVLEFWRRGSDWCLRLVPQIEQLAERFEDQPVVVLGMNTDTKEEDARLVAEKMALNYPTLRAEKIAEKYGVKDLPAVVVIDRQGVVRDYRAGYSATLAKELIPEIEELLSERDQEKR